MTEERQAIPIRIYDRDQHVVLAAPLPGLEPGDISVTVGRNRVIISGEERGPRQHGADLVVEEWTIGPYHREVDLQQTVNGPLTNATYGNGVLVLSMPKCQGEEEDAVVNFTLNPISPTRGERIGHVGSAMQPGSALEHGKKRS